MEMTKEELQRKVDELTQSLDSFNKNTEMLKQDLAEAERKLSVVNRPKITKKFSDELSDAISEAISNVDFTDTNAYDFDFEIDYDNRISLNSIEFNHVHDIADDIYSALEDLFNIIEDEDEN
jgi:hypothetical protein